MDKMVDIARERAGGKKLHAVILHSRAQEEAERLKQIVLAQFECEQISVIEVSGVVAVMNGRGLIDLGFYGSY